MARTVNIESVKVPNPLAMKFEAPELLLTPHAFEFDSPGSASVSPLAAKLFTFEFVDRVFIAKNFVTVSKREELPSWDELQMEIRIVIKRHLEDGAPLLAEDLKPAERVELSDPLENAIREAIEGPVVHATWQDGGEITFASFKDGVVKVNMAGACVGCPFAPRTLKHGVEVLLTRNFPEVTSVTSDQVNWDETQQA